MSLCVLVQRDFCILFKKSTIGLLAIYGIMTQSISVLLVWCHLIHGTIYINDWNNQFQYHSLCNNNGYLAPNHAVFLPVFFFSLSLSLTGLNQHFKYSSKIYMRFSSHLENKEKGQVQNTN